MSGARVLGGCPGQAQRCIAKKCSRWGFHRQVRACEEEVGPAEQATQHWAPWPSHACRNPQKQLPARTAHDRLAGGLTGDGVLEEEHRGDNHRHTLHRVAHCAIDRGNEDSSWSTTNVACCSSKGRRGGVPGRQAASTPHASCARSRPPGSKDSGRPRSNKGVGGWGVGGLFTREGDGGDALVKDHVGCLQSGVGGGEGLMWRLTGMPWRGADDRARPRIVTHAPSHKRPPPSCLVVQVVEDAARRQQLGPGGQPAGGRHRRVPHGSPHGRACRRGGDAQSKCACACRGHRAGT